MIIPTVHMNGSSKQDLLDGYCKMMAALNNALKTMQDYSPNARDYYVQGPECFRNAQKQYQDQFKAVNGVLQEIEQVAEIVASAGE